MRRIITIASALLLALAACAQTQTIRVFSHRGGRMEHDENTLQAFQASAKAGYRGFETDIRMTRDGKLIITHDSTLDRTTNGSGIVEEKTWEEIHALDTKKGNKMLTLDELLEFLKPMKGLYVEFELKTTPVDLYPYSAVMAAKPADAEFVFTSADYRGLRYLQQMHPGVDLLLITGKPLNDETIALCKAMGISRIGAVMEGSSRASVTKAHKEGLTVSLWSGQSVNDFVLGAYLGADFMCTDIPVEVKKFAAKKTPWLNVIY